MAKIQLSPAQQRVVDHRGTDLQLITCAGSGKIESISRRVAALIVEGAEPASIVAFTFTDRAAQQLKERIVRSVGEHMGEDFLDRLGPMFVGTINSYCFRLLQDHGPATATTMSSTSTATQATLKGLKVAVGPDVLPHAGLVVVGDSVVLPNDLVIGSTDLIFEDRFERGDTIVWSNTVLRPWLELRQ